MAIILVIASSNKKFSATLRNRYREMGLPVIPDIKKMSPKEGDLLKGRDPVKMAKALAAAGAPVLSVVTEQIHFGGSPQLLSSIVSATQLPVLRKDFITKEEQLQESVDLGASAVLLIASMVAKDRLAGMIEKSLKLDLEPLLETHDAGEIALFNKLSLDIIGINNRRILELEMDDGSVSTTEELIGLVRSGTFVISESSIASVFDIRRAAAAGAHAVLVGTAILQAPDTVAMYRSLSEAGGNANDKGKDMRLDE